MVTNWAHLSLDNSLLGAYVKLRHLCQQEPHVPLALSWNALALVGISQFVLQQLVEKGLIRWMQNKNTQFISIIEQGENEI